MTFLKRVWNKTFGKTYLMVSYNAGFSYELIGVGTFRQMSKAAEIFDKRKLRWTIEAEDGEILKMSTIHLSIIKFMETQ